MKEMVLENEALGLDQPEEFKAFSRTTIVDPSTPPSESDDFATPPEEIISNLANDLGNFIIDPEVDLDDENGDGESEKEEEDEELLTRNKASKRKKKKAKLSTIEVESEEEEYAAIGMVKKSKRGKSALKKSSTLIPDDDVGNQDTLPIAESQKLDDDEDEVDGMPLPAKKSRRAKKGKLVGLSTASPSISGTSTPALDTDVISSVILTSVEVGTVEGDDGREMSKKDKRRAKEAAKSGFVDELVRLPFSPLQTVTDVDSM